MAYLPSNIDLQNESTEHRLSGQLIGCVAAVNQLLRGSVKVVRDGPGHHQPRTTTRSAASDPSHVDQPSAPSYSWNPMSRGSTLWVARCGTMIATCPCLETIGFSAAITCE